MVNPGEPISTRLCKLDVLGLEDSPIGDQGWYETSLSWKGNHPKLAGNQRTRDRGEGGSQRKRQRILHTTQASRKRNRRKHQTLNRLRRISPRQWEIAIPQRLPGDRTSASKSLMECACSKSVLPSGHYRRSEASLSSGENSERR